MHEELTTSYMEGLNMKTCAINEDGKVCGKPFYRDIIAADFGPKRIRIHWRAGCVWMTLGCRACNYPSIGMPGYGKPRSENVKGDGKSFAMTYYKETGQPIFGVGNYKPRMRRIVQKHYKKYHPDIEIK